MTDRFDRDPEHLAGSAWALYHENSKRGRRIEAIGLRRSGGEPEASPGAGKPPAGAIRLPAARPLIRVAAEAGASAHRGEPMPLATLSAILATVCRPAASADPVRFLLHASSVEGLGQGLYCPDQEARWLLALGNDPGEGLAAAMPEPPFAGPVLAILFFVGALGEAARTGGERGYRRALVTVGRHALALDLAAAASGLSCREVTRFFDRELDRLLGLDGLAESVLHVAALASAGEAGA